MQAREILITLYLDYVNNYLTIEKFADHNGLSEEQARDLLKLGGEVFASPHPES